MISAGRSREIEGLAQKVIDLHHVEAFPVDLAAIAKAEGIFLAEDDYGADFTARIEFFRKAQRFVIYHPPLTPVHRIARIRFSIAHELGHFYLPTHAAALKKGHAHTSKNGFVCDNILEREADEFAASFLIPQRELRQQMERHRRLSAGLAEHLATHFFTSLECVAIRCVRWGEEAACVVVSEGGVPKYCVSSDEAFALGFHGRSLAGSVPTNSVTAKALGGNGSREGRARMSDWFPNGWGSEKGWEEVILRDGSSKTVTFLYPETD